MWPPRNDFSLHITNAELKLICKKKSVSNTASAKVGVNLETMRIIKMIKILVN